MPSERIASARQQFLTGIEQALAHSLEPATLAKIMPLLAARVDALWLGMYTVRRSRVTPIASSR